MTDLTLKYVSEDQIEIFFTEDNTYHHYTAFRYPGKIKGTYWVLNDEPQLHHTTLESLLFQLVVS